MLNPLLFNLTQEDFYHPSKIHGKEHVYRVMCHVLSLGKALDIPDKRDLAFFAAVIHDLSRRHDGICYKHGEDAVAEKLPIFKQKFIENGLDEKDIPEIKMAVVHHAKPKEIDKEHPFYPTVALLKDADGLDRVRLGDLNPRYFRYHCTAKFVDFAQTLFDKTNGKNLLYFSDYVKIAEQLLGKSILSFS